MNIHELVSLSFMCKFCCYICNQKVFLKMAFYDVLWQMPRDIKCHKVCHYGYQKNRLDQTYWSKGFKTIFQEKNQTKNAKNWNSHFSLVFLRRFLYNFQWICGGVKQPQNPKIFFPLAHICHGAQNANRAKRLDTFIVFTPP